MSIKKLERSRFVRMLLLQYLLFNIINYFELLLLIECVPNGMSLAGEINFLHLTMVWQVHFSLPLGLKLCGKIPNQSFQHSCNVRQRDEIWVPHQ